MMKDANVVSEWGEADEDETPALLENVPPMRQLATKCTQPSERPHEPCNQAGTEMF